MVLVVVSWVGWCLLSGTASAAPAPGPLSGAGAPGLPGEQFNRGSLEQELSRPLSVLRAQPAEVLRAHLQRLADLHFALELTIDVSPAERRLLSEQILARVGQVGLLVRQRTAEPSMSAKGRRSPAGDPGPPPADKPVGVLVQNAGLLVRLLGGLLIAFALGSLVASRRKAGGSSSRGSRAPRNQRPLRPGPGERTGITPTEIRQGLLAGRTVLLHIGCDITPSRRRQYLELVRELREILRQVGGQSYSVWEDPARPNRFYELLICRRVEVLDYLAATDGALSRLAKEIATCRLPDGFLQHRAWWGALPGQEGTAHAPPAPEVSLAR